MEWIIWNLLFISPFLYHWIMNDSRLLPFLVHGFLPEDPNSGEALSNNLGTLSSNFLLNVCSLLPTARQRGAAPNPGPGVEDDAIGLAAMT